MILSKQEKFIKLIAHIVLITMCVMAVIPFWLLLSASFLHAESNRTLSVR